MHAKNSITENDILQEHGNNQDSQRGLIDQTDQFLSETFEELAISSILHFTAIPDYKEPTDSKHPIVAGTSSGYFCLDGWNLLQDAKDKDMDSIICFVEYLLGHSEKELAICKIALRMKPRGGIACYSEIIRNLMLLVSRKDLENFHHGGDRKTEDFTNPQHQNVKQVLCFRLGKSITTINQYLNHAEFLSSDILNFFAQNGVEKDFFEKAQPNKRWQINTLRSQRLTDDEITLEISRLMLVWYEQFLKDKKIKPVWSETAEITKQEDNELSEIVPQSSPTEGSHEEISIAQSQYPEVSHEKPSHNYIDTSIESSPVEHQEPNISEETNSFERIKLDIDSLCKQLHEANGLSDLNLYFDQVMIAAKNLSFCIQALRVLKTNNS